MERFLLWKCSWAQMFQGMAGIITLGYWSPPLAMNSARKLTIWRSKKAGYIK